MSGGQGAWRDGAAALKGLRVYILLVSNVCAAISSRGLGFEGRGEGASLNLACCSALDAGRGGCSHMIPTHPGPVEGEASRGLGVLNGGPGV